MFLAGWDDHHINQLKHRYLKDQTRQELQMEALYDIFEQPIPESIITEKCLTKKNKTKRCSTEWLDSNFKRKK